MPEWIAEWWVKWLFGGAGTLAVGGITFLWRRLRKRKSRMDKLEDEMKVLKEGMEALMVANRAVMYDRLFYLHSKFMQQGWVSIPDLENVTSIYDGYCGLNGNHMGPKLYEDLHKLPNFEPM